MISDVLLQAVFCRCTWELGDNRAGTANVHSPFGGKENSSTQQLVLGRKDAALKQLQLVQLLLCILLI